jgi:exosortase
MKNKMLPKSLTRNGWTVWHLIAATTLMAAGIVVTRDAWADIYTRASRDSEASHIFLVPIVAAWLVWVRRGRLRLCQPIPSFLGPALVAIGWFLSSYGDKHAVEAFWHSGAVLIVVGALLSVVGLDVLFRFLPAFVCLGFLVPVPGMIRQQISIPLQSALAALTERLFELFSNVAIQRSGNLLSVEGTQVTIAEACNGMRMVFTLLLVSYLFAFTMPLRGYVRFAILAATPITALVANAIRLVPTLLMFGYFSNETATTFHDVSAWVMLFVAFIALMGIISLLRWALIPVMQYNLATR